MSDQRLTQKAVQEGKTSTQNRRPVLTPASHVACSKCGLGKLCIPASMDAPSINKFEMIVHKSRPLQTSEFLFRVGDRFTDIYAVRSGCFKTFVVDASGREQVLGFHLPGELIGLEAIYQGVNISNAQALGTSSVCRLHYDDVTRLAQQIPELQDHMFRLLSQRISELSAAAADHTADERMAGFLLSLASRFKERGYSSKEFNLAMSRADIANYLRLATETVSRVLARFQKKKFIRVERKLVELLDKDELSSLAGTANSGEAQT